MLLIKNGVLKGHESTLNKTIWVAQASIDMERKNVTNSFGSPRFYDLEQVTSTRDL